MLILALDTTSAVGGASLYRDQECVAHAENEGPANAYSVALFQMVDRLLSQAALSLSSIDLFAVANGPGSFTGIRIGVAATLGWAQAFQRPARGVSVLDAMVEQAAPENEWAVPLLDARKGEFFLGLYRRLQTATGPAARDFQRKEDGWVMKPQSISAFLQGTLPSSAAVTCIVREHDDAALALRESLSKTFRWTKISGTLVGAIARLALRRQSEGSPYSLADIDACYIRRPDAETNWKE